MSTDGLVGLADRDLASRTWSQMATTLQAVREAHALEDARIIADARAEAGRIMREACADASRILASAVVWSGEAMPVSTPNSAPGARLPDVMIADPVAIGLEDPLFLGGLSQRSIRTHKAPVSILEPDLEDDPEPDLEDDPEPAAAVDPPTVVIEVDKGFFDEERHEQFWAADQPAAQKRALPSGVWAVRIAVLIVLLVVVVLRVG